MSKERRIPPKGTVEHRRYWRDRRILDEMRAMRESLCSAATDATGEQKREFERAIAKLDESIGLFFIGHKHSYIKAD